MRVVFNTNISELSLTTNLRVQVPYTEFYWTHNPIEQSINRWSSHLHICEMSCANPPPLICITYIRS